MTRENELLKKIAKGETEYWEELIGMYYEDILRYCIYHVLVVVYANCDMYSPVYMGS